MLLPFALLRLSVARFQTARLAGVVALPFAFAVIYRFATEPRGPVFNRILVQTVQVQLAFSVLLSLGLLLWIQEMPCFRNNVRRCRMNAKGNGHGPSLWRLHRSHTSVVYRAYRLADGGICLAGRLGVGVVGRSAVDPRHHSDRHWVSINVSLTGFCPSAIFFVFSAYAHVGNKSSHALESVSDANRPLVSRAAHLPRRRLQYFLASILTLENSLWWSSFIIFVGGAMVWFAATGYCIMANMLY